MFRVGHDYFVYILVKEPQNLIVFTNPYKYNWNKNIYHNHAHIIVVSDDYFVYITVTEPQNLIPLKDLQFFIIGSYTLEEGSIITM